MKMKNVGRKLYHLSGLVLILVYSMMDREHGLIMLGSLFVIATALDIARLKIKPVNSFVYSHLASFIRESERATLTGSPWYILGILCSAAFFDLPVAIMAVAFLACGDVTATTVGERWGRTKLWGGKKSLEGTAAFIGAGVAAGIIISRFYPLSLAVIIPGALAAAFMEIMPVRVNDNLTIPLFSGAVMQLIVSLS
jgi:glycerol-3-phosphate acyltransferase PlsY